MLCVLFSCVSQSLFYCYIKTKLFIAACYLLAFLYTSLILFGPLALSFHGDESEWCPVYDENDHMRELTGSGDFNSEISLADREYANPDYITDPCRYVRLPQLVWLTLEECDMSRRMLTSVILGGAIGYVLVGPTNETIRWNVNNRLTSNASSLIY